MSCFQKNLISQFLYWSIIFKYKMEIIIKLRKISEGTTKIIEKRSQNGCSNIVVHSSNKTDAIKSSLG